MSVSVTFDAVAVRAPTLTVTGVAEVMIGTKSGSWSPNEIDVGLSVSRARDATVTLTVRRAFAVVCA